VNWDVSIALKHALIRVGSDATIIRPQLQSCLLLHLHTVRDAAGQTPSVHLFFLDHSVLCTPTVRTLSENSNNRALC
jgi:hypothetical protein